MQKDIRSMVHNNYISKHPAVICNSQAHTASAAPLYLQDQVWHPYYLFPALTCHGLAYLLLHSYFLHGLEWPLYLRIKLLLEDPNQILVHLEKQIVQYSINILHNLLTINFDF